jgi:hypothetical protein
MLTSLPLLHAAQSAVGSAPPIAIWLVCFGAAIAVGAAAGALSAGAVWSPRRRRTLALRAAATLTALALMPAVIPYDHLVRAGHASETAVHEAHCHESPAACADAPVTSGPGQMIDAAPLLVEPAMLSILLLAAAPILRGISRRPVPRPPTFAAVLSS